MQTCPFCRPMTDEMKERILAENDHAIATFDDEFREGHCLVTLKEHKESISQLTPTEYNALFELAVKASKALETKYSVPKTYMLSIGDHVQHFHIHLIPKHQHLCGMGVYCFQGLRKVEGIRKPDEIKTKALVKELKEIIAKL